MNKIILGLFLCTIFNQTHGQTVKPLGIGDTLPSIDVQVINGDKVESRPLSSFYKNTFLILDFWANWCGPCITAIADADSVANEFNGQVTILPITYQDAETIRKFVKNNSILNKLDLNYVTSDTVLMGKQIKFKVLPHEVWIDTNGVIRAITYPNEITSENVQRFVKEDSLKLVEKVDILDFDISKPLPIDGNAFLYRSVLTRHKPGLSTMIGALTPAYVKDAEIKMFKGINVPILILFYAAFSHSESNIYSNRIELNIIDTIGLSPFLKENSPPRESIMDNTYCYELFLPEMISKDSFYNYLRQDLNRLFKYRATIEKRKKDCWILVNTDVNKNPPVSTSAKKLRWDRGNIKRMENQTMDLLEYYLNWNMKLPVIDETGFKRSFDMDFIFTSVRVENEVFFKPETVKESLRKYGFDLKKGERFVDILVITEK